MFLSKMGVLMENFPIKKKRKKSGECLCHTNNKIKERSQMQSQRSYQRLL